MKSERLRFLFGQGVSLFLHLGIFIFLGSIVVSEVEFSIESGLGGQEEEYDVLSAVVEIEEEVVEEVEEEIPEDVETISVVEEPEIIEKKEESKPEAPKPEVKEKPAPKKVVKKSEDRSPNSGGVVRQTRASYLSNPAPSYPSVAKRKKQQGKVILDVLLNAKGRVDSIRIYRSSGYTSLDKSALKAVRRWRFKPQKLGGIAVASKVYVPVVFELDRK